SACWRNHRYRYSTPCKSPDHPSARTPSRTSTPLRRMSSSRSGVECWDSILVLTRKIPSASVRAAANAHGGAPSTMAPQEQRLPSRVTGGRGGRSATVPHQGHSHFRSSPPLPLLPVIGVTLPNEKSVHRIAEHQSPAARPAPRSYQVPETRVEGRVSGSGWSRS